jgi:hypothetical protein
VPSWDLRTLWVTNNAEGRTDGSLTPIDPRTGKPGKAIEVDDPYNMYATPDGKSAIVVAEARKRLDFRDPQTMALQYSIDVPGCPGINHADFSIDGRHAIFTCEFQGTLVKIDLVERKVLGYLLLQMPAPDSRRNPSPVKPGKVWEPGREEVCTVKRACRRTSASRPTASASTSPTCMPTACMWSTASASQVGFIATGVGAHGLYPSRDGKPAVRGQPRLAQDPRPAQGARRRDGGRLRHRQGGRALGRCPAAAAPTWATSAPTAATCGWRRATTT